MPRIAQGPRNLGRRGRRSRRYSPTPHPGLSALRGAEFFIDATLSGVSGGKLLNIGTGGSALDAQFGSTTGTDTNDPTRLVHSGTNYLYLPGVAGNAASTPDTPAVSVTGDFEMVLRVGLDDWSPAGNAAFFGKWGAAGDIGYLFHVSATGALVLFTSPDGTAVVSGTSSVPAPFVDGTNYWIRCTFTATAGGTHQVSYYYAADQATEPTSWTQIGAAVNFGAAGAIFNSTTPLNIGAFNGSSTYCAAGRFYRAILRNAITGGTTVFDADFTTGITSGGQTTFTESSSNAATVTINRATSGRKSVAVVRNVLLLGTDDYLEVADNALLDFALADNFSVLFVGRTWHSGGGTNYRFFDKHGAGPGWRMYQDNATGNVTLSLSDGALTPFSLSSAAFVGGGLRAATGVRNVTADNLISYVNNTAVAPTTDTTTTTLSNAGPMRIGTVGGGGAAASYLDGEIVAAAVFRRALTAAEIASIVAYYQAA